MKLQNLKYIIEIANHKSITAAAKSLYMTQSALSAAVKETEEELGIKIFERVPRGVVVTFDGEDFLKYCKEIVEKTDYLTNRYKSRDLVHTYFSVSTQHLPFAVRAFITLLNSFSNPDYDLSIRETDTMTLFHDIHNGRSELGVAAFLNSQLRPIQKALFNYDLEFHEITQLDFYVFLRKNHPLASKETISLDDLEEYPFITYDQESEPNPYTEEILFYQSLGKNIHVNDRSTKLAIIRGSDAVSIGIDLPNSNSDFFFRNRNNIIIAVPLKEQLGQQHIGYLTRKNASISYLGNEYLTHMKEELSILKAPLKEG